MFDRKIDVALIMKQIKQQIIPEDEWESCENREMADKFNELKSKIESSHYLVSDLKEHMEPYLETGFFIPTFARFPKLARKALRFFAKSVARSTRFITREQNFVNHDLHASVEALLESQQNILQELERLEEKFSRMENSQREFEAQQTAFRGGEE